MGTLNIWGRWADWPARLDALRAAWPDPGPDVLLLQEVRRDAAGDQAEEVAAALGYPERAVIEGHRAEDGTEGLAILARCPLHEPHGEDMPTSEPTRRVLAASVDIGGRPVRVVCAHTVAVPEDVRRKQVRALLARSEDPLVLGADLNDTPEALAPLLRDAGLRDSLDGGTAATWPMSNIVFSEAWMAQLGRAPHFSLDRRRLDYLLSRGLDVLDGGVEELCGPNGRNASDHALVWACYAA
jgi:endonuclease/exonuclease/phosphatase family metal-dependent hydrolase